MIFPAFSDQISAEYLSFQRGCEEVLLHQLQESRGKVELTKVPDFLQPEIQTLLTSYSEILLIIDSGIPTTLENNVLDLYKNNTLFTTPITKFEYEKKYYI